MIYSPIMIKACAMCLGLFVTEYFFGKARSLFDQILIILLVFSAMLLQKADATEYTPLLEYKDVVCYDASIPHFPKPKMPRNLITADCRLNEAGIAEVRRTGKEQCWEGLNRHADLYYYYVDALDDLLREQQRQDTREIGAMIYKACVLSAGGFAQFCFAIFVDLSTQNLFQTKVNNYYGS